MSKPVSYAISQHQEGICLNPLEYVLDGPDGDIKLFDRKEGAVSYLRAHWEGMPESIDDLDEYGIFITKMRRVEHGGKFMVERDELD